MSGSEKTNTAGRYLLNGTCRYFTLFCVILLLVAVVADNAIHSLRFLMLLPFAFCVAAGGAVYRFTTLSAVARHLLHYLLCQIGFFFAYLPWQISDKNPGKYTFMVILLTSLAYAIGLAVFLAVRRIRRGKVADKTPYESQFSNLK